MIQLLKGAPLFQNLSDENIANLVKICEKKSVGRNTKLFSQGDLGNVFYIIVSGSVKIFNESGDGKEKIITILKDGDSFGEFSILDGGTRSASAEALEDTLLLTISLNAFHLLLERDFSITFTIIQQLVSRLRKTNEQVMDLVFLDAKAQIYKTLLNVASQHGKRVGQIIDIQVPFAEKEIAKMAGISEEVTNIVLEDLISKGVLTYKQNLIRLDLTLLSKNK